MSAVISKCGRYRYALTRAWSTEGGSVTFIGVNPSTADACTDDATVRKWRGFATRWGFGSFRVANLFSYRATNVKELASVDDPVGPLNDDFLFASFGDAELIVPCWGDRGKLPRTLWPRIDAVRSMLRRVTIAPIHCLGLTAGGDPKHPLMLGYSTERREWIP
jgi:hypothetical protein